MNRDQIKALSIQPKAVHTQAWGEVLVRSLRADELESLLEIMDEKGASRLAKLAILGCVEADGDPLFRPDDESWLISSHLEPLAEIADAFLTVNGVSGGLESEKKTDSIPSNTTLSILPTAGDSRSRR